MKEIHIARALVRKRKEKGITQEELARYIGVTKASVSKWETGQSYPDISLLPQLAAYFNISVDELIGYEAQMTKEDMKKLYHRLSADFAAMPFDEVLSKCHDIVRRYYSCFPLLFYMGILMLNHSALSGGEDNTAKIVLEAKALFERVKDESGDTDLAKQAKNMEAMCLLALGKPRETLGILDETTMEVMITETIYASACQMLGETTRAKKVLQIGIYQHLLSMVELLTCYAALLKDDAPCLNESCRRVNSISEAFKLACLNPAVMMKFYIIAAEAYMAVFDQASALDALSKYAEVVNGEIFPLKLHGDDFFNLLDGWLSELALGIMPPRDEKTIRKCILEAVELNTAFAPLAEDYRFNQILNRLKNSLI